MKKKMKGSIVYMEMCGYSEAMRKLPLVKAMFPWTTATKTFQELLDKEALLSKLAEEFTAMILYMGNSKKDENDEGKNEDWKENYLTKTEEADKAIGKQFRRASATCHPDKYEGKFAAKFTALASTYEFLKDSNMRQSYFRHILPNAFDKHDFEDTIILLHDEWIKEHSHSTMGGVEQTRFQKAMQQVQKRTQQTNRMRKISTDQPLAIQGGLSSNKPRLLGVGKIHGETRMVQLMWQPLQPVEAFRNYCENVVILIDEENVVVISNNELEELYSGSISEYKMEIRFPSWGIFHVSWYAQLIVDGREINTEPSDSVEITVLPSVYEQAIKERPTLLKISREMADRLQKELDMFQKQLKMFRTDRVELQKRNVTWHRALGNAQSLIYKLENTLKELDQDPNDDPDTCPQLLALKEIVKDAAIVQPALVDALEFLDKKMTRKSFAQAFAAKLAKGIAGTWLVEVSEGELAKLGGDTNRLYQFLTQGKANSLFLDSTTLRVASSRTDLFSCKQRKTLLKRSDAMEAQKRLELDLLIKEQLKKDAAEKEDREKRDKAKTDPLCARLGTKPEVVGLKSNMFARNDVAEISTQHGTLNVDGQKDKQPGVCSPDQDDRKNNGVYHTPSTAASSRVTHVPDFELPPKHDKSVSPSTSGLTNFGTQAPIGSGRSLEQRPQAKNHRGATLGAPFLPLLSTLDTGLSKPQSSMSPLTVTSVQSDSSSTPRLQSLQELANQSDPLLEFLQTQKDCLKQSPKDFHEWLLSEDVTDLSALAEAVTLNEFLHEMKNNGLKGFKRQSFKDNCLAAVADPGTRRGGLASKQLITYLSAMSISLEKFYKIDSLAPQDLVCPISLLLMVVDPVVATDGHTYERDSLEDIKSTKIAFHEFTAVYS
eukprot:scaffold12124_cov137-Amphora_coffeaeformis.AAC.4